MSLRHAFRNKFRSGSEKDGGAESKTSCSSNQLQEEEHILSERHDSEEDLDPQSSPPHSKKTFKDAPDGGTESKVLPLETDERQILEAQLTQLQEQLVASMIENETIANELKDYKEKNLVAKIKQELEYEKQRSKELFLQITQQRKKKQHSSSDKSDDGGEAEGWVDLAQEATEDFKLQGVDGRSPEDRGYRERIIEWLFCSFYELMADFTEEAEPEDKDIGEGETLTVKKLKENIKRFKNSAKPIMNTFQGVYRIFTWKHPAVTLISFNIYMYSVWHGWLLQALLLLAIFQLSISYLRKQGWNITLCLLGNIEDEDKNKEAEANRELGMSDKFNLVVQVARQVQNTLGQVADNLEKVKNLLTWQQPECTRQIFFMLIIALVVSSLLKGTTLFTFLGLYFGVKMFVIEYIYDRFPRFKQRHDGMYKMWQMLPNDRELEQKYQQAAIDMNVLPVSSSEELMLGLGGSMTDDERSFCDLHSLPASERPLPSWQGGRRCTLINKDKSLTSAFKNGRLYLTHSFLCFERSKTVSSKNFTIPLSNIVKIEKAKPYTWMPGAGMSIEITVKGQERPLLFGVMLNRDDCFESLLAYGRRAGLQWAIADSLSEASSSAVAVATDANKSPSSPTVTPSPKGSPVKSSDHPTGETGVST